MFYLIIAIILVLFYLFVAPNNIKGTMNVVIAVFLIVILFAALLLGFLKIMEVSLEVWLGIAMVILGLFAMRDINHLDRPKKRQAIRRLQKK
ncbi:TPA: DUF3165 family protein [Streptococcus suis]|uniref:DUF3165 family protein n=1 Tax=Streptococcus suivaginalis TaxID=3028082 RepID=A0AA97A1C0_9STRE|nr:DUF3165 family protein [Streptococcus sp. 29896]MBM7315500.1 DUF3165 family protein [Streptococcus suis]MCK4028533.1 DUF3165 family protein [Streptococcus suis]WNY47555.1 DUF3165 family protein [Streptococcus sp. 29896]